MHDIGKSVMGIKFPERYSALVRTIYNEDADGMQLELDVFGFDHTMVGEAILHSWNLAKSLETCVRHHHDPLSAPPEDRELTAFVALGNQVALDRKIGLGRPESLQGATAQAMAILKVTPEQLESYTLSVMEALESDKTLIREF
jgi:HD-like signal output (HDOD) protein